MASFVRIFQSSRDNVDSNIARQNWIPTIISRMFSRPYLSVAANEAIPALLALLPTFPMFADVQLLARSTHADEAWDTLATVAARSAALRKRFHFGLALA